MDNDSVQMARDSLSRCNKDAGFLDRFYEHFMGSSAEIRDKFSNTDFEKQKKVLSDSLFLMLTAAGTKEGFAHAQLEKLAHRHSRNELNIKPEWYDLWLQLPPEDGGRVRQRVFGRRRLRVENVDERRHRSAHRRILRTRFNRSG